MDKHDVVDTLRSAALAHKKWTANALALIEGVPLDKAQVPVNSTECEFANANREAAMKKYHILENRSDTIIKQLVQLERVVMAMGDEQLHRYVLTEQPAIHIH